MITGRCTVACVVYDQVFFHIWYGSAKTQAACGCVYGSNNHGMVSWNVPTTTTSCPACPYTHTHTHAHMRTRAHARTHTHTNTHTNTRTHEHTNTHTNTRTHTHMRARAHAHIHTHTHARARARIRPRVARDASRTQQAGGRQRRAGCNPGCGPATPLFHVIIQFTSWDNISICDDGCMEEHTWKPEPPPQNRKCSNVQTVNRTRVHRGQRVLYHGWLPPALVPRDNLHGMVPLISPTRTQNQRTARHIMLCVTCMYGGVACVSHWRCLVPAAHTNDVHSWHGSGTRACFR